MKSFPFDSQVIYDGQGNPSYDRGVNSSDLAENISLLLTNGVIPNPATGLQVTESENSMSVLVQPGACCINGRLAKEDSIRTIVFEAANSIYDRIDRVVLRLNTNVDVRDIDIYVVKGVASANPVPPALTREGGIYELGIANVFVARNTTYISAARITDTRLDNSSCGLVSSLSEFDSTALYNQIQSDLSEFKTNEQADFVEWLDTIKDILDDNAAGHLQNEIDESNARITANESNISELRETVAGKQDALVFPLTRADIVNNGVTADSTKALSASYGKALQDYSNQINSSLQGAITRIGTLENSSTPRIYFGDYGAIDENSFITYLRAWIKGNTELGRTIILSGFWDGKVFCGHATRIDTDIYFAYVNVRGGSVYALDDYSWGKL